MKKQKSILILILVAGLLLQIPALAQDSDFQPSGKPTITVFSNFRTTFSNGGSSSAFAVERAYLGYEHDFSEKFSAKVQFDVGDPGVGNHNMSAFVKNAYFQYKSSDLTLAFGMISTNYFKLQEKLFNYRFLEKPFQDLSKIHSSADIGISLSYKIGSFLEADLMIVNGEGYKSVQKDSTYNIAGGINIFPFEGFILRAGYDFTPGNVTQTTTTLFGSYGFGPARLGLEYTRQINSDGDENHNYGGISITAEVDLSDKVALYTRFDRATSEILAGETDPWNLSNDRSYFITGFDYRPVNGIRISPNYRGLFPSDEAQVNASMVMVNIEVKF